MNLVLAFFGRQEFLSFLSLPGDETIFFPFLRLMWWPERHGRLSILQADDARNPKPVVVECLSTENGPATVRTPAKS